MYTPLIDDEKYRDDMQENIPDKVTVYPVVFRKRYDNILRYGVPVKDLPELQEGDLIDIEKDNSYYVEADGYEAYTLITIRRPRMETDEEVEARIKEHKRILDEAKEARRQTYLRLKKEFE